VHAALLFAQRCRAEAAIIQICRTARKLRRGRRLCCPQTCHGPVALIGIARHTAGGDQLIAVLNDRAFLGAVDSQVGGLQWIGLPAADQISQHLRRVGEH
jgi:hypothetical protein